MFSRLRSQISWGEVDFYLFCCLFFLVLIYQIQFAVPAYVSLHVRELLYAYLYIRVVFFYKKHWSPLLIALLLFLVLAVLVGINTFIEFPDYGLSLALKGFSRFVNVALLAPIAAVLLKDSRRMKVVLGLWASVILLGVGTVAYQFLGGQMDWLVRGYIAIRADLVRYKSLLGEPNVGGMCAGLLYAIAIFGVKNRFTRWFLLFAAYFLLLVSLSKAGLFGFAIVNLCLLFYWSFDFKKKSIVAPPRRIVYDLLAVGVWALFLLLNRSLLDYTIVHLRSFFGGQYAVPGAAEDFKDRALLWKYGQFLMTGWSALIGGSYGSAGSAALELNVPKALGPHNSYLEIFIVGGLAMLGSFLGIQWFTLKAYINKFRSAFDELSFLMLLLFGMLSLYMLGYPSIYEPEMGALFWVLVGYATNVSRSGNMIARENSHN